MGDSAINYGAIETFADTVQSETESRFSPAQESVGTDLMSGMMSFGMGEKFTEAHDLSAKSKTVTESMSTTFLDSGKQLLALFADARTAVLGYKHEDLRAQVESAKSVSDLADITF